jgi:hypothetical protein
MADPSPAEIVQHGSTLSILWGVLLIVFGMLAVGSPLLAAVAVVFPDAINARIRLGTRRWDHHTFIGAVDLSAMAVKFGMGDRHVGRCEHDNQRRHSRDVLAGSP